MTLPKHSESARMELRGDYSKYEHEGVKSKSTTIPAREVQLFESVRFTEQQVLEHIAEYGAVPLLELVVDQKIVVAETGNVVYLGVIDKRNPRIVYQFFLAATYKGRLQEETCIKKSLQGYGPEAVVCGEFTDGRWVDKREWGIAKPVSWAEVMFPRAETERSIASFSITDIRDFIAHLEGFEPDQIELVRTKADRSSGKIFYMHFRLKDSPNRAEYFLQADSPVDFLPSARLHKVFDSSDATGKGDARHTIMADFEDGEWELGDSYQPGRGGKVPLEQGIRWPGAM